ncbi:MAG: SdrD B-like domain [Bacillales bacterium]|jgi:hypothetical protein|nr:SdrD B-like domain [Bacillales bacterium]
MKKFGQLLFVIFIITFMIFPIISFAEGEVVSQPGENVTNLEMTQMSSFTNETMQLQANKGDVAAVNNGKISGFLWNDANKDGIYQTETEKPITGISVYLYNSGNAISSTTTLATGDFSFTGLAMSNYEIIINQNNFGTGSILSTKFNWSSSSKNNNFSKKSNDASIWTSGIIALGNGETLTSFGCGVYDPTRLPVAPSTTTPVTNTNPKTADETLYTLPLLGLIGAGIMIVFSRRKISNM